MLAAQLIACHNAAMECYRRAADSKLPARDYHLNQANKLSRTYSTLLEALNRHRGKGQQKVMVEHVHVHQGGQAIVGHVEHDKEGVARITEDQPHAPRHAASTTVRCKNPKGYVLSIAGNAERSLSHARGQVAWRSERHRNAWKHGHYSSDAIATRTVVRQLLAACQDLISEDD
jgi:hypothetical protein